MQLKQIEDTQLLRDILNRNYFNNNKNIEIILSNNCCYNCKDCFLRKKDTLLYPFSNFADPNESDIINNYQDFIQWYIDNNYSAILEFSGTQNLNLLYNILDITYIKFKEYKQSPTAIIIYNNMIFLKDEEYSKKIFKLIQQYENIGIQIHFKIKQNGKFCDDPLIYDDEYYNKLCNFLQSYPFSEVISYVTPENVSQWITNYKWWITSLGEVALQKIKIIELQSNAWTKEKINEYILFLDFQIDFFVMHVFPKKDDLLQFIYNKNQQYKFNTIQIINHEILENINHYRNCNFHNNLIIDITDLSLLLCHKINFKDFKIGHFEKENNTLSIYPDNYNLIILKAHLQRGCSPHCEKCKFLDLCEGFCYGASYENNYNVLMPIKESCELAQCKFIFLFYKYNLIDCLTDKYASPFFRTELQHFKKIVGKEGIL